MIEAIVNHVSAAPSGRGRGLQRARYLDERRQALELWGAHVATLIAGRLAKVVPLKRA